MDSLKLSIVRLPLARPVLQMQLVLHLIIDKSRFSAPIVYASFLKLEGL